MTWRTCFGPNPIDGDRRVCDRSYCRRCSGQLPKVSPGAWLWFGGKRCVGGHDFESPQSHMDYIGG